MCYGPNFDELLGKLPVGLEEIYETMLRTLLSRGGSGGVLNMFRSVALALRPLTFGELSYLTYIQEETRGQKRSSYRVGIDEIRPKTQGEIKMYVRSSLGFLRATNTTISIVHHTAIEYLFGKNRKNHLPILSRSEAELAISWECFQYLHHAFGGPGGFPRGGDMEYHSVSKDLSLGRYHQEEDLGAPSWEKARKDPHGAVAKWPFLRYAAESWFIHARQSIEIMGDKFCDDSTHNWLQHRFFESSDVIRNPWIKLCGDSRMKALAGEQTPLHIAVSLGLIPLVENALTDFTEETNTNQSPLHLAARFLSGAYKILIDNGGPSLLTAPNQNGNTPLHEAAISGHSPMLVALMGELATHSAYSNEINKQNRLGNTPLHLAFQFDHTEIVDLLVRKGADTTIKNNAQMTALELGAKLGRGDSLDILKGAQEMWEETRNRALEESVDEPVEALVEEEPVEALVEEEPVGALVEEPVEAPMEGPAEAPAEELVEVHVDDPAQSWLRRLSEASRFAMR